VHNERAGDGSKRRSGRTIKRLCILQCGEYSLGDREFEGGFEFREEVEGVEVETYAGDCAAFGDGGALDYFEFPR
jgi:hypothetical protein